MNMAESVRSTVSVVPLNSSNYATWKIQAKMTLLKERLWKIVDDCTKWYTDGGALSTLGYLYKQWDDILDLHSGGWPQRF